MESFDVNQALKAAIQTEKDAMDFYRFAAEKMSDERARKSFEILARDEMHHARSFYDICRCSDLPAFETLMAAPPNTESGWWKGLQSMLIGDFDERRALELAVEQEEALEKELRAMAAKVTDPQVRQVYEANASSTHGHSLLVLEDLRAFYGQH